MDPLSIAASTIALATLCKKLLNAVYGFSDTTNVDTNVDNLYEGLVSLSNVLTSVSTAWSKNPLVAAAQTGPDGHLWICVRDSLKKCEAVLKKLDHTLGRVSAENVAGKGFMRRPVKQMKLNMSMKDIQGFRSEFQTHEMALGIALSAINTCAAMRREDSDAEVMKRLVGMAAGIEGLSQSLRNRQIAGITPAPEATPTLEQFLQAATKFNSRANTEVNGGKSTVRGGISTQNGGSIFGDAMSQDHHENIENWIPPPTPLEGPVSSTATGGSQHGFLARQSSLPDLMAMLQTVTQMADQYRNSEEERNMTKDEQLRQLETQVTTLEKRLNEQTESSKSDELRHIEAVSVLEKAVLDAKKASNTWEANHREKQVALQSVRHERDTLKAQHSTQLEAFKKQNKVLEQAMSSRAELQGRLKTTETQFEEQLTAYKSALEQANACLLQQRESEKQNAEKYAEMKTQFEQQIKLADETFQNDLKLETDHFTKAYDKIKKENTDLKNLASQYLQLHNQQGQLFSSLLSTRVPEKPKSPREPETMPLADSATEKSLEVQSKPQDANVSALRATKSKKRSEAKRVKEPTWGNQSGQLM